MRGLVALIGAILLTVVPSTPGSAALWVRIEVGTERPVAGWPVRVTVQGLVLYEKSCLDDPGARVEPAVLNGAEGGTILRTMRVRAERVESGEAFEFVVELREDDPSRLEATVDFAKPGVWHLVVVKPDWSGGSERCTGAGRVIVVRPSGWRSGWS